MIDYSCPSTCYWKILTYGNEGSIRIVSLSSFYLIFKADFSSICWLEGTSKFMLPFYLDVNSSTQGISSSVMNYSLLCLSLQYHSYLFLSIYFFFSEHVCI